MAHDLPVPAAGELYLIDFSAGKLVPIADPPKPAPAPEPARYMPAYCDPANEWRGKLYDRNLSVVEIARLIRAAIKAELPKGLKVSVVSKRHRAIRIKVKELPPGMVVEGENPEAYGWKRECSPEYCALMDHLKEILNRWNRDNSDVMVDYFDVNYYDSLYGLNGGCW